MATDYDVTFSDTNYKSLVIKEWGKTWGQQETAYEFSNGRKFESTDNSDSGIYDGT
jgi:hypothetical protein